MTQCTWNDPESGRCEEYPTHPQIANDGSQWANLCHKHHSMMEWAIGRDVRKMLAYWVRAQGGSKAAARRMTGSK